MLKRIKIVNFKSIQSMDLCFKKSNNIVGNNGVGKTNVLQAISCLFQGGVPNLKVSELLRNGEKNLYIEGIFLDSDGIENKLTFYYDLEANRKLITLNGKRVEKKALKNNTLKISYFSPTSMNLFYLGPKDRRDFLDSILKNVYDDYEKTLNRYEKILKNRNKVLKNIFEGKSKKREITFWDSEFIKLAKKLYGYRIHLNEHISNSIKDSKEIFQNKISEVSYKYITKVDLSDVENCIKNYLDKNLDRDVLLQKTHIGPHIDDFDILIDGKSLAIFASRGEIKSVIINLKLIEIDYIKNICKKTPIILIDDLTSELDSRHLNLVLEKLSDMQLIFTSISAVNDKSNIIKL